MAKYCGNCGTKAEDMAKVCGNCGTLFSDVEQTVSRFDYVAPEKKQKQKKKIKRIVSVIIIVCSISVASNFVGYKGTVGRIMNAYKKYDIDGLCENLSGIYSDMETEELFAENLEYVMEQDFSFFDREIGYQYKINYEIIKKYSLPSHKYKELIEEHFGSELFDEEIWQEVIVVEVAIKAEEDKKSVVIEKKLYMTKEENSWKLLDWE